MSIVESLKLILFVQYYEHSRKHNSIYNPSWTESKPESPHKTNGSYDNLRFLQDILNLTADLEMVFKMHS